MDKETLSNYGWIVVCVMVLAVMLALATPFGTFVADGFKATYTGLFQTGGNAMDTALGAVGIDTATSPVIKIDQELSQNRNNPTIASENSYSLSGKIEDNNGIKSLSINNSTVDVNNDGTWSTNINLTKNELVELTIVATNTKDKSTTEKFYIGYLTIYDVTITSSYFDFSEIGYERGVTTDLVIPAIYQQTNGNWRRVVGIGIQTFHSSGLKTLVIPDTVTSVGVNAFRNSPYLESVVLGDGMTSVASAMFTYCESLKDITFGKNITAIESSAFYGCTSLTSITIPEGITKIEQDAFRDCENLESIVLPVSLTTIGKAAFADCKKITDVYYRGTQEQWEAMDFNNDYNYHYIILENATIHYNYTGE